MALPLINQPALGGIKDLMVARGPKERSRYVGHVAQGPSILPGPPRDIPAPRWTSRCPTNSSRGHQRTAPPSEFSSC
ncbi:hypothetical protein ALC60_08342 [Trachymyrmex zeteki]|uniref:Uncharacterized protein n=1 Tax=Mycetomoellerius zeteki TaxID=64791 RepID=A0A151WX51_9HYME|nr:hypothetical protein ALC60_08342 [Trachymyrmex zeteki]